MMAEIMLPSKPPVPLLLPKTDPKRFKSNAMTHELTKSDIDATTLPAIEDSKFIVAKSFNEVGNAALGEILLLVIRSFCVMATSAKIQPEMTLQRYARIYRMVILSKPGPTANSGNTKHPAPTVFPVINNAHETMGSTVPVHHVCRDS